jgi:hypothetical protein
VKEERNTFSKFVATLPGGYSYRPRTARNPYYHGAGLFPSQGRVDDNPQRRPAAFLIWFVNSRLSRSSTTSCTNIRSTPSFILKSHSRAMRNTLRSCPTNMSNKAMLIVQLLPAPKEWFTALAIPASNITPTGVRYGNAQSCSSLLLSLIHRDQPFTLFTQPHCVHFLPSRLLWYGLALQLAWGATHQ